LKFSQKIVACLASLLLIASAAPALAADPYSPDATSMTDGQILTTIVDGGGGSNESDLVIQPGGVAEGQERGPWLHCYGSGDPTCDYNKPGIDIMEWAILPNCSGTTSPACVKSLDVAAPGEDLKPAKFLGEAKGGMRIAADPATTMIEGARPSLFEASNAPNEGGTLTYAVMVIATSHFVQEAKKYQVTDLTAKILPYRNLAGNFKASYFDKSKKPAEARQGGSGESTCAFIEDGNCGFIQDFKAGTRFKLQMTIPSAVGGWFQGRLRDPQVKVSPGTSGINELTIEAEPVTIPRMAVVRSLADYTPQEKTWYQNNGHWGIPRGIATGANAGQDDVFKYIEFYRPIAKDTSSGVQTFWNLGTVMGGAGSKCLQDTSKVLGIVTTNSMGFDGRSPAFEKGFLNYRVTGLHYMPDGTTPVQGTYDLVMRSDTARCLYGFTNAPISATVSVVGGDTSSVATTVVSEKNGWLKMAAYGFTFSEKTLTVHMTQATAPVAAKKSTITCVKGKVTKKVTATSLKCPVGYQKK
jgi:hypothetical protein